MAMQLEREHIRLECGGARALWETLIMAYTDLSDETMVALSGAWVVAGAVRSRLQSYPALNGLLGLVERAHTSMLTVTSRKVDLSVEKQIAELSSRANALDVRHDAAIRAGIALLDAAVVLAPDDETRARVLDVRRLAYPMGSSLALASHAEEAVAARALEQRLRESATFRHDASTIVLSLETQRGQRVSTTLEDLLDAQVEAGRALGQVTRARDELEGASTGTDKDTGVLSRTRARSTWVRATTLLVTAANELESFTDDDRRVIFGELSRALTAVDRKAVSGST